MKRVIYIQDTLNNNKYILQKEYGGFGVYQRMTPSGYYVHQDWLISNGDIIIICASYNNLCEEELYDAIDSYNESKQFNLKVLRQAYGCYVHPSGTMI